MQELNAKLMARAQEVEQKHNLMLEHVGQMNECLKQKTLDNERLQMELNLLKRSMKVWLASADDTPASQKAALFPRCQGPLCASGHHALGAS